MIKLLKLSLLVAIELSSIAYGNAETSLNKETVTIEGAEADVVFEALAKKYGAKDTDSDHGGSSYSYTYGEGSSCRRKYIMAEMYGEEKGSSAHFHTHCQVLK